jgi:hypothetical protein
MADDPLADFLKRQADRPTRRASPSRPVAPQRLIITRLHLPFGDVFRLVLQMTAASLVIGLGLWVVVVLLMLGFGGLAWLAR